MVGGCQNQTCRWYPSFGGSFAKGGSNGIDITSDVRNTVSVALGDVDGDGDLDLVTGNVSTPNRLYLNNGTINPFGNTAGIDITTDADHTNTVLLGDVDSDGDLDLVAANNGTPSRLYLNNGTSNPFAEVAG